VVDFVGFFHPLFAVAMATTTITIDLHPMVARHLASEHHTDTLKQAVNQAVPRVRYGPKMKLMLMKEAKLCLSFPMGIPSGIDVKTTISDIIASQVQLTVLELPHHNLVKKALRDKLHTMPQLTVLPSVHVDYDIDLAGFIDLKLHISCPTGIRMSKTVLSRLLGIELSVVGPLHNGWAVADVASPPGAEEATIQKVRRKFSSGFTDHYQGHCVKVKRYLQTTTTVTFVHAASDSSASDAVNRALTALDQLPRNSRAANRLIINTRIQDTVAFAVRGAPGTAAKVPAAPTTSSQNVDGASSLPRASARRPRASSTPHTTTTPLQAAVPHTTHKQRVEVPSGLIGITSSFQKQLSELCGLKVDIYKQAIEINGPASARQHAVSCLAEFWAQVKSCVLNLDVQGRSASIEWCKRHLATYLSRPFQPIDEATALDFQVKHARGIVTVTMNAFGLANGESTVGILLDRLHWELKHRGFDIPETFFDRFSTDRLLYQHLLDEALVFAPFHREKLRLNVFGPLSEIEKATANLTQNLRSFDPHEEEVLGPTEDIVQRLLHPAYKDDWEQLALAIMRKFTVSLTLNQPRSHCNPLFVAVLNGERCRVAEAMAVATQWLQTQTAGLLKLTLELEHPSHEQFLIAEGPLSTASELGVAVTTQSVTPPLQEAYIGTCHILVHEALVSTIAADAILLPATPDLCLSGTDTLTREFAAVRGLTAACAQSIVSDGILKPGTARAVGKLHSTSIIHAAALSLKKGATQYTQAVCNALALMVERGWTSIGIPVRRDLATTQHAHSTIEALRQFAFKHPNTALQVVLFSQGRVGVEAFQQALLCPTTPPPPSAPYKPRFEWFWVEKGWLFDSKKRFSYAQAAQLDEAYSSHKRCVTLTNMPRMVVDLTSMTQAVGDGKPTAVEKQPLTIPSEEYLLELEGYTQRLALYEKQLLERASIVVTQRTPIANIHFHGRQASVEATHNAVLTWYRQHYALRTGLLPALSSKITVGQLLAIPSVQAVVDVEGVIDLTLDHAAKGWSAKCFRSSVPLLSEALSEALVLVKHNVVPEAGTRLGDAWTRHDGSPWTHLHVGSGDLLVAVVGREFNRCERLFQEAGMPNVKLKRVERVQNPRLWVKYTKACEALESQGHERNEKWLFHGTRSIDPTQIARTTGIDFRHSSEGLFGRGAYFAERSEYSAKGRYIHTNAHGEKQMFLAQVAAGKVQPLECHQRDRDMKHPAAGFDSVRGHVLDPDYYAVIVYEVSHSYPAYILTY
jgi:hypothetical protein